MLQWWRSVFLEGQSKSFPNPQSTGGSLPGYQCFICSRGISFFNDGPCVRLSSSLKLDKLNKTVFMHDNFELIADYTSYVAVPRNAQKVTQIEPDPTPGHSSWH